MKVVVREYNERYKEIFEIEKRRIENILGDNIIVIYHIGSTSVEGLKSKPIIDIMPVVKDLNEVDLHNEKFEELGYECMGEYGILNRRFFKKGRDNRTHHIHIFPESNEYEISRHLAFRDFLRKNEEIAKEYGELKEKLAKRFPNDIDSYIDGKDRFVKDIEKKAMLWYKNSRK